MGRKRDPKLPARVAECLLKAGYTATLEEIAKATTQYRNRILVSCTTCPPGTPPVAQEVSNLLSGSKCRACHFKAVKHDLADVQSRVYTVLGDRARVVSDWSDYQNVGSPLTLLCLVNQSHGSWTTQVSKIMYLEQGCGACWWERNRQKQVDLVTLTERIDSFRPELSLGEGVEVTQLGLWSGGATSRMKYHCKVCGTDRLVKARVLQEGNSCGGCRAKAIAANTPETKYALIVNAYGGHKLTQERFVGLTLDALRNYSYLNAGQRVLPFHCLLCANPEQKFTSPNHAACRRACPTAGCNEISMPCGSALCSALTVPHLAMKMTRTSSTLVARCTPCALDYMASLAPADKIVTPTFVPIGGHCFLCLGSSARFFNGLPQCNCCHAKIKSLEAENGLVINLVEGLVGAADYGGGGGGGHAGHATMALSVMHDSYARTL